MSPRAKDCTSMYVDEASLKGLALYKYRSEDTSLLSIYFYQPLWRWLTTFMPMWLAPNTITTLAFAGVVINFLTMALFAPNMTEEVPSWVYLSCGVGILAYQTLDAIDGKQARRTNSSSPLGELFDHGCDALNCAFSTATLSATLMAGSSWATWVQMWCTLLPFYFTTWEEYHTGVLFIGIINGPTEGLLTVGLVHLYAGIFGPAGLHKPLSDVTSINPFAAFDPNVTIANAMIYSCCVVIVFTVLNSFLTVRKEINETGKTSMAVAFAATTPMIIQFIFANAWVVLAPEAWHAAPRLFIVVQGFIFSKYTGRLILAHVCHQRYSPFESALIPLVLGFLNAIYPVFDQVTFLWAAFFFTFTQYAYMAYTVVTSITTFLGIKCFTIPYKKQ